jgi:hypothetical protein
MLASISAHFCILNDGLVSAKKYKFPKGKQHVGSIARDSETIVFIEKWMLQIDGYAQTIFMNRAPFIVTAMGCCLVELFMFI